MISAKIIADSKSQIGGHRLTSMIVTFPRIVLSEFNTHRMLTKNSASSRAIPFKKMMESVRTNPFIPIRWQKDHKGMQGTEYLDIYKNVIGEVPAVEYEWLNARNAAVEYAMELNRMGVTKQLCNRLLEPFMWHTVIVTGTEWENFFALRAHPAAEIHIAALAGKMLEAYNASTPKVLQPGEWHIPFGDQIHDPKIWKILENYFGRERFETGAENPIPQQEYAQEYLKARIKIATARCAGVSYTVIGSDGKEEDYDKLISRHDMLASMGHWSPFEHCAKAMSISEIEEIYTRNDGTGDGWCGNFRGFIQYRKMFNDENRKDPRVLAK